MGSISPELLAILGVVGVHLFPKLLQRFRIPAPVTALLLGAIFAAIVPGLAIDPTLTLLSTIGIASLFLFAGLEVDAEELGKRPGQLAAGLVVHAVALGLATMFGVFGLGLDVKPAMILGLGIATPSGGFILDGLSGLGADEDERHRIRDAALTAELLALVIFFGVTQSSSVGTMIAAVAVIIGLLVLVPMVLRGLSKAILPYAPKSEFPLLVLSAVLGAYVTRKLGVYYLVGAFVVGVVARRLKDEVPALASEKNLSAIELFAAFFAPFYFARAGMTFDPGAVGLRAIGLGAVLLVFATPARIALMVAGRHFAADGSVRDEVRLATAIIPTFVFSLVMARVLEDDFHAPAWVQGGLLVYAVLNAFVPTIVFGRLARRAPTASAPTSAPATAPAPAPASAPAPLPEPTEPTLAIEPEAAVAPDSPDPKPEEP